MSAYSYFLLLEMSTTTISIDKFDINSDNDSY